MSWATEPLLFVLMYKPLLLFLNYFPCFFLGSPIHVRWKLSNLEQLQLHGSVHEAANVADHPGEPNRGLGDQGEGLLGGQKAMA